MTGWAPDQAGVGSRVVLGPRSGRAQSIARIKASPFIPHRDAVRGFVYEVETGRLREVV